MSLLVHHNFPDEEANGVAMTANPFDPSGLEPGFYVNVQWGGDAEVVAPPPGVTSDHSSTSSASPASRSSISPTPAWCPRNHGPQTAPALRARSRPRRHPPAILDSLRPPAGDDGWYAMDVEFKFDGDPGETPKLFMKQARPYPGRGN